MGGLALRAFSTALRMNSPRLFGPAMASMLTTMSAVRRTADITVSTFCLSGGRPIRRFVPDFNANVKLTSTPYTVIDPYIVYAYGGQTLAFCREEQEV